MTKIRTKNKIAIKKKKNGNRDDLCRLDNFSKGTIFKIECSMILTRDAFKLINQLMRLQNPFPLSHIPSNKTSIKLFVIITQSIKLIHNIIIIEEKEEEPGEERNEFVTVSRESILNSVSDTGNSGKLRLRRHLDEKERSPNKCI
jgi:hypothetical protein